MRRSCAVPRRDRGEQDAHGGGDEESGGGAWHDQWRGRGRGPDEWACGRRVSVGMLKNAVESLPELMGQKSELEKHTTILKGVCADAA